MGEKKIKNLKKRKKENTYEGKKKHNREDTNFPYSE